MDVNDLKGLSAAVKTRMDAGVEHVRRELSNVRTGRASVGLLENVQVEAYGSKMPLNQVAGLSIPEPAMIIAQPYDPQLLAVIEKAIRASDLGLNPSSDGKVVRIPIPALTDERRKELSRHVHKLAEEGRNVLRQVRREANERLKKLLKDHAISEDDERRGLDEVQKITDGHIKLVDDLQKKKDCCRTARDTDRRRRRPSCSSRCPSRTSNARGLAGRRRAIRARVITCARAALPCWRATIWRPLRSWARESLRDREPTLWRYRELLPVFPGEAPVSLGEGFTPLLHAPRLGAELGLSALYVKDESPNPTNSFKARGQSAAITRARALGATHGLGAHGGQRRLRHGGLRRVGRPGGARLHAARRQAALRRRVHLARRVGRTGRRPHHRCRPRRRRARRPAGLVRRLDAEGAVSPRGQEDDGVRAGRAARLALARCRDLPDRRRHRPDRDVERLRGTGSHRLGAARQAPADDLPCRPTAARPSSRRLSKGAMPRRRSSTPTPSPTACACRARWATS